jgi:nucleoside-diphosphate-sugar epimerase
MDLVIHLAAMTHVDDSLVHPDAFFDVNALGTVQVLKAVTQTNTPMLYVSSSEVYGDLLAVRGAAELGARMHEEWPMHPCSPYAVAKAAADMACQVWHRTFGTDVRIVRPFNQYGPGQTKQKLFPRFVQLALEGKPLTVYGDGSQTRDYVYVDDTVAGIWAARHLPAGEVVNLCSGDEISVREIADRIVQVLASKSVVATVGAGPRRPGEVQRMVGDPGKARERLGWTVQVTLDEGIRRIAEWYMVNGPIPSHLKHELRR